MAGAWRFVQCNWGARHLVNAKEVPKPGKAKSDSLRYESIIISYIFEEEKNVDLGSFFMIHRIYRKIG